VLPEQPTAAGPIGPEPEVTESEVTESEVTEPAAVNLGSVEPATIDLAVAETADAVLAAARALLAVVAVSMVPVLDRVTLPQLRALVLLSARGRTRIGSLAQSLGVHQSTFTRTTDRMAEAGLVRRLENPENRREVIVEATEAGLELVRAVADRRRREVQAVLARMSPDDRARVLAGLQTFARIAGDPPVEVLAPLGG
jgi:DNA-binding MarR family transcriptional regulator